MSEPAGDAIALVPARGRSVMTDTGPVMLAGRPLLAYTVEAARAAQRVRRVIVSTEDPRARALAQELGAEAPFLRPAALAARGVSLDQVMGHAAEWVAAHGEVPAALVLLEVSHPLRPSGMIDRLVELLLAQDLDTVFVARPERGVIWMEDDDGALRPLTREDTAAAARLYKEVAGMGTAVRWSVARAGKRLGDKVGVLGLDDPRALIDTEDHYGFAIATSLLRDERPAGS